MPTIIIVIDGGCVVDVKNLPDGWYYEVDDRDIDEEAEAEAKADRLNGVTCATQIFADLFNQEVTYE